MPEGTLCARRLKVTSAYASAFFTSESTSSEPDEGEILPEFGGQGKNLLDFFCKSSQTCGERDIDFVFIIILVQNLKKREIGNPKRVFIFRNRNHFQVFSSDR